MPQIYVGDTVNVKSRLLQHSKDENKNFGEYTCIVTSKDQNLTKAHARYLENQLISIIQSEGRAILLNGATPDFDYLPEAGMDYFREQLRVVLPSIGLDFLARPHGASFSLNGKSLTLCLMRSKQLHCFSLTAAYKAHQEDVLLLMRLPAQFSR